MFETSFVSGIGCVMATPLSFASAALASSSTPPEAASNYNEGQSRLFIYFVI
jgi:hypothetical protein